MSKLKKQFILIGVIFAVALILIGVWFFATREEKEIPEEVVRDEFGVIMKGDKHFMHDPVEVSDLNSIYVHNLEDEYTILRDSAGNWKFSEVEGYELNPELLATLRTNTRYLLAVEYVDGADLSNPEKFGLTGEIFFEVSFGDGGKYKVIVGDKTPDNGGYYAMLDGREALYVLDSGLENSVFLTLRDYINPVVADTIDTSEQYSLERLSIFHKGDAFVRIDAVRDGLTYGNISTHRVTYPSYNYATNLANFPRFLEAMMNIQCSETVLFGEGINAESLAELGFIENAEEHICDYTLTAKYPGQEIILHFIQEEETYLIYSEKKNIVVRAPKESFFFLDWELISWVSSEVYLLDIFDVATMEFSSGKKSGVFEISGEKDIAVKCNGTAVSAPDFKSVYQSFLYLLVTDWATPPEITSEIMHLKITLESGEVLDYSFTSASAVNSFYTLNGFGQFYVSREKLMEVKGLFESLVP